MKKITLLVIFVTFFVTGIIIQGCQKENSTKNQNEVILTKAELFVASEKFQNHQKLLMEDSRMMNAVLSTLTNEKRGMFKNLVQELSTIEDFEQKITLYEEISSILGFNYFERINKLKESALNTFKGENINPEEFMAALEKSTISPRLKSSEEGEEGESLYDACCRGCHNSYNRTLDDCNNIKDDDAYLKCFDKALSVRELCELDCWVQYPD